MTPEEQKLQAAIAAAMNLPSEPEPAKPDPLSAQLEASPAVEAATPQSAVATPTVVEQAAPVVAASTQAPQSEERDWSEVDQMLEESFEGRRKKQKSKGVLVNSIFCALCLGVIGSAAYWYVSSESNQAKVSSIWNDVKAVKDDVNPAKIVESYQESLDKIEAHQDRMSGENSFSWDAVEKAEEQSEAAATALKEMEEKAGAQSF